MENTESQLREQGIEFLREIFEEASHHKGEQLLNVLVRGLGMLMEAETTFVARALDTPPTRVRGIAAWKDGAFKEPWEYSLAGNPCQLTYEGRQTFIPCDIAKIFESKKDSGYASYIGVPLFETDGTVIGHIAIYASTTRAQDAYAMEVAQLCGYRAEAEIRNMIAEEKLERQISRLSEDAKLKDEAVRTVAHDLRSPLATVITSLSYAETRELPDEIAGLVSIARQGAERLLTFASDYLEQERLDHTSPEQGHEEINIDELSNDLIADFLPRANERNLSIKIKRHGGPVFVHGNPQQLRSVLENLLSNAAKFSPPEETIMITVDDSGDHVRVSISDNGPGVEDGIKDSLFDPYSRGDAPKNTTPSSGLGLSIAKDIIERHGGRIGFENGYVGVTFYVDLPKA